MEGRGFGHRSGADAYGRRIVVRAARSVRGVVKGRQRDECVDLPLMKNALMLIHVRERETITEDLQVTLSFKLFCVYISIF